MQSNLSKLFFKSSVFKIFSLIIDSFFSESYNPKIILLEESIIKLVIAKSKNFIDLILKRDCL